MMKTSEQLQAYINLGPKPKEISVSSASPMKTDQDVKEEEEEEDISFSLSPKATLTRVRDVSKPIYLFGVIISAPSQKSSSLASTATSTKKRSRSNNAESSINPKEEIKEEARNIKKTRYLSDKERTSVSTGIDLNNPPCTITKELTASDVGGQSRLMLETNDFERHILSNLCEDDQRQIQDGDGVCVNMYDHDTNTEHGLVMKRMVNTTRCYVINGGWLKHIVRRRELVKGDKIGLLWNCGYSRLHFCVLSRAQNNYH